MERFKISKSLNDSNVSKFATRNRMEVKDLLKGQYSANKNIRFKAPILRSNLCDYSNVYIVLKRRITVIGTNNVNKHIKS